MAHDVFVSYSQRDKPAADAVVAGLEQAGVRCWVAPRDILAGKSWAAAIMEALAASRAMVVVLSVDSNSSGQVLREVERAVTSGLIVVPFRIEPVDPTGAMAYFLGPQHWLDALTPPLERHVGRLATTLRALLQMEPVEEGEPPRPSPIVTSSAEQPTAVAPPLVEEAAGKEVAPSGRRTPPAAVAPRRVLPWYRRPLVLAGAGVLLLAAVVVPIVVVLSGGGGEATTTLAVSITPAVSTTAVTAATTTTGAPTTTVAVVGLAWERVPRRRGRVRRAGRPADECGGGGGAGSGRRRLDARVAVGVGWMRRCGLRRMGWCGPGYPTTRPCSAAPVATRDDGVVAGGPGLVAVGSSTGGGECGGVDLGGWAGVVPGTPRRGVFGPGQR